MPWWAWLPVGLIAAAMSLAGAGFLLQRPLRRLRQDPLIKRVVALPLAAKLRLVRRLLRDKRVPRWAKALLPALALYLAMPFDLVPDFIPVVGYLDDLLLLLLVASLLRRALPGKLIEEYVRALEDDAGGAAASTPLEGRGR